jgi:DNA recombination protein RmuC
MEVLLQLLFLVVGLVIGGLVCRMIFQARLASAQESVRAQSQSELMVLQERVVAREQQLAESNRRLDAAAAEIQRMQQSGADLQAQTARLETALKEERARAQEKAALLNEAQVKLSDAFKALSSEALKSNNQSFMELAKATLERFQEAAKGDLEKRQQAIEQIVKPVQESLGKFDSKIQDLEKARVGAYEVLREQVKTLNETQNQLRQEAANLVKALGTPHVRGRWGEIQLRRVVEMAGMLDHCDFYEQQNIDTEDGRLRPDLIVKLPGAKHVVVDAKAPLSAYLDAMEAKEEGIRQFKLQDHARQIRDHMKALSQKSYWDQFESTPEFVVLFLPGETFFSAALEQDPALIEQGVEQRIILATPTTLIALLKAVAYGWRQASLADNARHISELGKELYKRIKDLSCHFADMGSRLEKAVESYNKAAGTLESRVLVSARRFRDLESVGGEAEIELLEPVDSAPRQLQSPELSVEPEIPAKLTE